jgi:hypothetical protein
MMKKNRELICLGDHDWYEVVVHDVQRYPRRWPMETPEDAGGIAFEYTILDMDGNDAEEYLFPSQIQKIEDELEAIYS